MTLASKPRTLRESAVHPPGEELRLYGTAWCSSSAPASGGVVSHDSPANGWPARQLPTGQFRARAVSGRDIAPGHAAAWLCGGLQPLGHLSGHPPGRVRLMILSGSSPIRMPIHGRGADLRVGSRALMHRVNDLSWVCYRYRLIFHPPSSTAKRKASRLDSAVLEPVARMVCVPLLRVRA